jgi:hypothetical protein
VCVCVCVNTYGGGAAAAATGRDIWEPIPELSEREERTTETEEHAIASLRSHTLVA